MYFEKYGKSSKVEFKNAVWTANIAGEFITEHKKMLLEEDHYVTSTFERPTFAIPLSLMWTLTDKQVEFPGLSYCK